MKRNPFVRRMGLRDVARAEDDGRNSLAGQYRGVAEIMRADRPRLAGTGQKLSDERPPGVRFQWRTRRVANIQQPRSQLVTTQQRRDFAARSGFGFAWNHAPVDA